MRYDDKKRLPEGVSDVLPGACKRRRQIEEKLLERFCMCGYDEVRTPVLEYFSLYQGTDGSRETSAIKTFDRDGRILALRPEFTTPIARMVSTRMQDAPLPLRLCYQGVAFRSKFDRAGLRGMEFTQAGVELLGLSGPHADAEVIALAASSMEAAGLRDYLIDIGQVEFFKGLMEEAGADAELSEELRVAVEQKSTLSMEMLLRSSRFSRELQNKIMALPSMYGGPEVIYQAMGMTRSPRCRAALDNLLAVYGILDGWGLSDRLTIDLGLVHSIDYYTGVVFRGISGYVGSPILSGGRYDRLMDEFGAPSAATGFALGVERLLEALWKQDGAVPSGGVDIVAACTRYDAVELAAVERWRAQGKRVELWYGADRDEMLQYAASRGARAVKLSGSEVVDA